MPIELRVLSGARSGARQRFDKSVIAIGRHPMSDLQFDPERDLDVSARHAEIRGIDSRYTIYDSGSTNGTFVNGERIGSQHELLDGDVVAFGEHGPRLEVRVIDAAGHATGGGAGAPATRLNTPDAAMRAASAPSRAARPAGARSTTAERVAIAVQEHTRGLQRMLAAAIVILGVGVGFAYWLGHRESRRQVDELMTILAQNESTSAKLQTQLERIGASGYAEAIKQHDATLRSKVESKPRSPRDIQALKDELRVSKVVQQGLALMDLSKISDSNDAAVAFLVSELDGKPFGGTAFGITRGGLMVTNRHNVRSDEGNAPTRIAVKFANTDRYLHARVVKVSSDSSVDLALVQIEESGTYPVVSGVNATMVGIRAGSPVVTIGFPHSLDTPQDGETVKTSLEGGMVSKRLASLLQIDSYAGHGSSGSPIFDVNGYVVGVLFGGAAESQGRIVYAVPADKLAAFLPVEARAILR